MSITHTIWSPRARISLTEDLPVSAAITFLGHAARARVASVVAAFRHRRDMERVARFSDHRLQDVGYERDWDGSINPVTPDLRFPWANGK